jgi:putative toxin-antitoxin system antitoxin component (TIGR02293 family)
MSETAVIFALLGGRKVFKTDIRDEQSLYEATLHGYPAGVLSAFIAHKVISADEKSLIAAPRTLARRRGRTLSREESERALRIARVVGKARDTFANEEKADRWLRKANRSLRHRMPLAMAASDVGARLVEKVLTRIAYGDFT